MADMLKAAKLRSCFRPPISADELAAHLFCQIIDI
jgi:hypothetical protein